MRVNTECSEEIWQQYCLGGLDTEAQHTVTGNFLQYKSKSYSNPFSEVTWKFLDCIQKCSTYIFVQVKKFSFY